MFYCFLISEVSLGMGLNMLLFASFIVKDAFDMFCRVH